MAAPAVDDFDAPPLVRRQFGFGYPSGTGFGLIGASAATTISPRLTLSLEFFAATETAAHGGSIAPVLEARLFRKLRASPYVALGPQYQRLWFGDASGGGVGGFFSTGYDVRLRNGLQIQLGFGVHVRQDIRATEAQVTTTQRGTFGLNLDLAIRYWLAS